MVTHNLTQSGEGEIQVRVIGYWSAALVAALLSAAVLADDPRDPAMRSAAAQARDHETIRQMNLREIAYVRARDARDAQGWRAWRDQRQRQSEYSETSGGREQESYARRRAQYDRDMAAWRRAVAACRAGDYSYCDR